MVEDENMFTWRGAFVAVTMIVVMCLLKKLLAYLEKLVDKFTQQPAPNVRLTGTVASHVGTNFEPKFQMYLRKNLKKMTAWQLQGICRVPSSSGTSPPC